MTEKQLSREEWLQKGKGLFGENILTWKFICPSCGHVQTPEDFRPYKDKGCTPETAYFNCIGRYDGNEDVKILSGKSPCNYTGGGLFGLNPVTVILEDGKEIKE